MNPPVLVLGTHNKKKLAEMKFLLQSINVEVVSLSELADSMEVEETGSTFEENASLKACEQASHLGRWVLAEDSGLSVRVLDGAPGVYSARYSGPEATDERNNQKLLSELGDRPLEQRGGWYTSHLSLADPTGERQMFCEATCHGRILFEPRGSGGFGYDPLFELPEYHRTFAELGPVVKSVLSHRGRAHRMLVPKLRELFGRA